MDVLGVFATAGLGLLAGSLALEGAVLVPAWRGLPARTFGELHAGFGPRLYRYFAPVTVLGTGSAIVSGLVAALRREDGVASWCAITASLLAASLLAFYRLYFESANERVPRLATAGADEALAAELERWQRVHVARTAVCVAAFVLAAVGLAA